MSASNPTNEHSAGKRRGRGAHAVGEEGAAALHAIRRIIHAVDLHSRQVARGTGLTLPQLVVLEAIQQLGEVTSTAISARAALTPATVTTIVDNLEERGLVERYRSGSDRRVVHARLTTRGSEVLADLPRPLHGLLLGRFTELPAARRRQLLRALTEMAGLISPPGE